MGGIHITIGGGFGSCDVVCREHSIEQRAKLRVHTIDIFHLRAIAAGHYRTGHAGLTQGTKKLTCTGDIGVIHVQFEFVDRSAYFLFVRLQ